MKAIMYHYVRPSNPDLPFFRHLELDDFRRQLDHFAANDSFVSKQAFLQSIERGEPVEAGVVLTFDDGFKDHFRYVLPELMHRDLWGIFYIPVLPYLGGRLLDVHRIHLLLGKLGGRKVFEAIRELLREHMLTDAHREEFQRLTYDNQNNDDYTNHVKRTLNYFIGYQYREAMLDNLMARFFADEEMIVKDFYMTGSEIRAMKHAGMIIGSHTVNHPVMSKLSVEDQEDEIDRSFRFLESLDGPLAPKTFCYPYGGFHTFNSATERLLEKHQCDFAFNVEARDIDRDDLAARRQALPRFDCNMFPYGACQEIGDRRIENA